MTNSTTLRADLQINGVWTNITSDVYTKEAVAITRGRTDESSSPQAAALDITLNNRTGKYTPTNPAGAFYPNLNRQTPIRLGMGIPPAGTGQFSTVATTAVVAPAVNAEVAGIAFASFATLNISGLTGPAGYTNASTLIGNRELAVTGFKTVSAGTVSAATATGGSASSWGAASAFLPGSSISVTSSQQHINTGGFANLTNPAVNAITFTPVSLSVGDVIVVAQAWSGDFSNSMTTAPQDNSGGCSWVLLADSGCAYSASVPRVVMWAFYSDSAQTVTVTVPNHYYYLDDNAAQLYVLTGVSEWNPRFGGQCATFNTTADLSGADVRTTLEAGSVLRQRGQGQETPRSAYYRFFAKSQAYTYWPIEGNTGAALTSPLPGVPQAQIAGPAASFGSTAIPGSDSIVSLAAGSYFQGQVPAYTAVGNTPGSATCVFELATSPAASPSFLSAYVINGGGSTQAAFITLQYVNTNDHFNLVIYNASGGTISVTSTGTFLPTGVSSYLGRPIFCALTWAPNLANPTTQTDFQAAIFDITSGTLSAANVTGVTCTVGQVETLFFGTTPFPQTTFSVPVSVGHVSFVPNARLDGADISSTPVLQMGTTYYGLGFAWGAEDPIVRMTRVTQEQSMQFQSRAPSTDTQTIDLGQQDLTDSISLLEECQESDGEGELFEARGFAGLTYRSVGEISGSAAQVTLDYTGKQITAPFQQIDDDQLTRNDVTVQQVGGASQRVYLTAGPLSIQPPPVGIGTFTGNPTVNVSNQSRDLIQLANWFVHIGTTNAPRYGAFTSQLASSPTTISAVSSLDCGQHFTLTDPPSWSPPGPIELVCLGYTEHIGDVPSADWAISYNARPYAPFQVARPAATTTQPSATATLDSGSSTLTAGVSSGATSISVTTTNKNDLWTTTNVPFDIVVSGERMTVTAVTGATSPQTFTVTRSVNGVVKAQTAGSAIDVYFQERVGLSST